MLVVAGYFERGEFLEVGCYAIEGIFEFDDRAN